MQATHKSTRKGAGAQSHDTKQPPLYIYLAKGNLETHYVPVLFTLRYQHDCTLQQTQEIIFPLSTTPTPIIIISNREGAKSSTTKDGTQKHMMKTNINARRKPDRNRKITQTSPKHKKETRLHLSPSLYCVWQ